MGAHNILSQSRYKKQLTSVPFFFTFANAFLGFVAITQALEGRFIYAAYSLLCAALMDICDGRLARALGSTSSLGSELDSLADGISFVLAPCVMWYLWYPASVDLWGWSMLAAYLSAGLYRLARFNVMATKQSLEYSVGLPVPAAAVMLVSCILYYNSIERLVGSLAPAVLWLVMALLSLLMISTIPFPTPHKQQRIFRSVCRRWQYWGCGAAMALFMMVLCAQGYPVPLYGMSIYVVGTLLCWALAAVLASW